MGSAKEILKQIIFAIIMIVLSVFLKPVISSAWNTLTGSATTAIAQGTTIGLTAGVQGALTYSSYAMQIFGAFQQGKYIGEMKEIAEAKAEREYARRKASEADYHAREAFMGTMGTMEEHQAKDHMMFYMMFNPFDFHQLAIPADEMNSNIKLF
jgi:hypothetical protein